ncbi:DUF2970 domain-containing protein [Nevskia sp.]|uniref:DUF2970 domain-containing protein n=1 Tax=Nevskia sp. TaxID=1929292 RepID=UPI003F715091
MSESPSTPPPVRPPSLIDTILSVLASFFGVQSHRNRVRDFSAGKPMVFIIVAIVLTVVFVLSLLAIVKLLLRDAGV